MRTSIQVSSTFLRLLYVAGQPPDAVRPLRGPPASRPSFCLLPAAAVASPFDLDLHAARAIIADLVHRAVHERVTFTQLDSSMV